jgi:hypothetical protein
MVARCLCRVTPKSAPRATRTNNAESLGSDHAVADGQCYKQVGMVEIGKTLLNTLRLKLLKQCGDRGIKDNLIHGRQHVA